MDEITGEEIHQWEPKKKNELIASAMAVHSPPPKKRGRPSKKPAKLQDGAPEEDGPSAAKKPFRG